MIGPGFLNQVPRLVGYVAFNFHGRLQLLYLIPKLNRWLHQDAGHVGSKNGPRSALSLNLAHFQVGSYRYTSLIEGLCTLNPKP